MTVTGLTNVGEFFSEHYLATALQGGLTQLKARWDREERAEKQTTRRRVRGLGRAFFADRAEAAGDPQGDGAARINHAVLDAFGFHPRVEVWETERGEGMPVRVPIVHRSRISTGTHVVALALPFLTEPDAVFAHDADNPVNAVRLIDAIDAGDKLVTDPATAISTVFACDDAPRFVLLVAGALLVLADRATWSEGRYLVADLDGALGRADNKELDTLAALFSADALVPDDGGQAALDALLDSSRKQAVGVSKDLREGLRRSVELLANEVANRRLDRRLPVYNKVGMERDLTRESLRWLYRVLVLLFAEARSEMGVLPTDNPEYHQGYGLDRLRELALRDLHGDHARNGTHLHESVELLCRLVHEGHNVTNVTQALVFGREGDDRAAAIEDVGLRVMPLDATLFSPDALPLFKGITLRNEVVHQVLGLLLLTKSAAAPIASSCRTRRSASTSSAPSTKG